VAHPGPCSPVPPRSRAFYVHKYTIILNAPFVLLRYVSSSAQRPSDRSADAGGAGQHAEVLCEAESHALLSPAPIQYTPPAFERCFTAAERREALCELCTTRCQPRAAGGSQYPRATLRRDREHVRGRSRGCSSGGCLTAVGALCARAAARAQIQLMKPGTWIPVCWGVMCGAAASGNYHWLEGFPRDFLEVLACIVLSGPCLTGFTQVINDWYDKDIDAINEPNRPIPSGRITGEMHPPYCLSPTALHFCLTPITPINALWTAVALTPGQLNAR
jgi:hypothetical protein